MRAPTSRRSRARSPRMSTHEPARRTPRRRPRSRAAARLGPAFGRVGRACFHGSPTLSRARHRPSGPRLLGSRIASVRSTNAPMPSRPSFPKARRSAAGRWAGSSPSTWRSAIRAGARRWPSSAPRPASCSSPTGPTRWNPRRWRPSPRELHADRAATLAQLRAPQRAQRARGREAIRTFTERLFERGTPLGGGARGHASRGCATWTCATDALAPFPATLVIHGARDALAPVEAGAMACRDDPRGHARSSCPTPRTCRSSPTGEAFVARAGGRSVAERRDSRRSARCAAPLSAPRPRTTATTCCRREVGRRPATHLDPIRIEPTRIVDLGCGTGRRSTRRWPGATPRPRSSAWTSRIRC